ncbi:MAG: hypothetical protein HYX53_06330 [Chloroflexi bacterium]|nr:hypothetical protein [Chloroflexota bacterium]
MAISEGEGVGTALQMLQDAAKKTRRRVLADAPRGEVPKKTIPVLERNARWFYGFQVAGESIRHLAQEEYGDATSDRRKDVREGIREARRLLDLNPYVFDADGVVVKRTHPPCGK